MGDMVIGIEQRVVDGDADTGQFARKEELMYEVFYLAEAQAAGQAVFHCGVVFIGEDVCIEMQPKAVCIPIVDVINYSGGDGLYPTLFNFGKIVYADGCFADIL